MKRLLLLVCFAVYASFAQQIDIEQYELPLHYEESEDGEPVFPPIIIQFSVTNISDSRSSNTTNIDQEQELTKKELVKKQRNYDRLATYAKGAALAIVLLNMPHKDPATLYRLWKLAW